MEKLSRFNPLESLNDQHVEHNPIIFEELGENYQQIKRIVYFCSDKTNVE